MGWQGCREKRVTLEGSSVLGQWLKSHFCPRSWFMQSGRADPQSKVITSTILEKETKINWSPPSVPAALKTRKQTPTSVFILLLLCTAHSPQGTPGACVQTSTVVLHQALCVREVWTSSTTALAVLDAASYASPYFLTDLLLWWEKPSLKYWTPCYLSCYLLCAGISWCVFKQIR